MQADKSGLFGAGGAVAGIAASACCLPPILFAFGVGGLGFLSRLDPFRPVFIAAAAGMLGYAFYKTYRRPKDDADCCPPERLRTRKVILWVATILAGVGVLFPYLLAVLV